MCVLDIAADHLNRGAQRAGARAQQREMDRLTGVSRDEFDRRMGYMRDSDGRVDTLLDRRAADTAALESRSFADLLDQTRGGFDEQLGIAREGFDQINLADSGLVTASRQARLSQLAVSAAERARQQGFQSQADDLASALPGNIGFSAQDAARGAAAGSRMALSGAAMTGAVQPKSMKGMDPLLTKAFEQEASRGAGEAGADAASAASFASFGDAFAGSERALGSFADALSSLNSRAQLSRASLGDELAVGGVERDQASARRDFSADLAGRTADQRGAESANYRGQMTDALTGNARQLGDALARFFDSSQGSEGNYTQNLVGSSRNFENTRVNLGNYRNSQTTAYSPLGNLLNIANQAAERAARASAGAG